MTKHAGTDFDLLRMGFEFDQLTLFEALSARARAYPERVFLTDLDTTAEYTYDRLVHEADLYSRWLAEMGVRRDTHVAVQLPNGVAHILIYIALSRLGAVAVPLNVQAKNDLLRYYLTNSDSRFLLHDASDEHAGLVARGSDVAAIGLAGPWSGPDEGGVTHEDICAAGRAVGAFEPPRTDPTALGYVNYTSGTTGPSKGVMMTHARAMLWGFSHAASFGYGSEDRVYVCLPLFHVNAFQGALHCAIGANSQVFLRRRFSASKFWGDMRSNGITATNLLGSMAAILWKQPPQSDDANNDLRMVMTVPIPSYATDFEERFGLRFTSGYSLTDYGPSHAYTLADPPSKLGSAGRPRPGMEARIVDANDLDVACGTSGELVIRTSVPWNESTGYYGMPEQTLASRRNGWFHTGDLCRIDADGYMWFEDRLKDVIRRRGENISAFELERAVSKLDGVRDVAAVAVPSELEEDEVALFLELSDASPEAMTTLQKQCESVLPRYMHPEFYVPVETLPRNASHKIEKYKLKSRYSAAGAMTPFRRQA
ncbi:ATP-dependent acyl-CoA ligase [Streptomyces sp. NWU339]|uniref:AMP-binding protein n=1 Tax=Streptomyces sp. NWU339 TaxID=2185284 RepID=UPI000D67E05E|nr:AMP-binding protein [Streptomyces sp. NWU339]PWI11381.1 ATP-dependent acyl-CoA ligase [Streptomyces sp. NWU339]